MSVTTTQAHTKNIIITRLAYTISRLSQHHLLLVIVRQSRFTKMGLTTYLYKIIRLQQILPFYQYKGRCERKASYISCLISPATNLMALACKSLVHWSIKDELKRLNCELRAWLGSFSENYLSFMCGAVLLWWINRSKIALMERSVPPGRTSIWHVASISDRWKAPCTWSPVKYTNIFHVTVRTRHRPWSPFL